MKLLIDIGNSRIKWAYMDGGILDSPQAFSYKDSDICELLENKLEAGHEPDKVFIANVAGESIGGKVSKLIEHKWDISPGFARVERQNAGVVNAYKDIDQLGIDRWLGIIAAWVTYRSPVCVVSCGTALTIDAVSESGRHLGGFIVPGPRMMTGVLARETSGINSRPIEEYELKFGTSTSECINNGSVRAIVSLINNVSIELAGTFGNSLSCIITGGFAEQIINLLDKKFVNEANLVLTGLGIISDSTL